MEIQTFYPGHPKANSRAEDSLKYKKGWDQVFAPLFGAVPYSISNAPCAQFQVTRRAILSRPRDFYNHILSWLRATDMTSSHAGWILEYSWHWIFNGPFVYNLPGGSPIGCLCEVFGNCPPGWMESEVGSGQRKLIPLATDGGITPISSS